MLIWQPKNTVDMMSAKPGADHRRDWHYFKDVAIALKKRGVSALSI
ncbi:MAG: hypothetical protein AAF050_20360 [Cyanobacteria bacterium J06649_5]